MRKLLLMLILPLSLFCASEDDTCFMEFYVPHIEANLNAKFYQYCINGYSFLVHAETEIAMTQNFISLNGFSSPATCSCEIMRMISKKDKELQNGNQN